MCLLHVRVFVRESERTQAREWSRRGHGRHAKAVISDAIFAYHYSLVIKGVRPRRPRPTISDGDDGRRAAMLGSRIHWSPSSVSVKECSVVDAELVSVSRRSRTLEAFGM